MQNFWENKKILITGHSGFKGMWLSIVLKTLGGKVYGLSDFSVVSNIYQKIEGSRFFEKEFKHDISKNPSSMLKIFKKNEFDVIFHFAAQAFVLEAKKNPLKTLETNIIGTYNLISKIGISECTESLIVSTTDKVYRDTNTYNTEESPLGGNEFYSASKVATENIIDAFLNFDNFDRLKISTVRSGNVLGAGDGGKGRLITDLLDSVKNEKELLIRNPNAVRPWLDVLDSINGYLKIAEFNHTNKYVGKFNLNSKKNSQLTVNQIVDLFIKTWGSKIKIVFDSKLKYFETNFLKLDSSKAREILNWKEKIEIKQNIEDIVKWEKANSMIEIEKITLSRINKYFE